VEVWEVAQQDGSTKCLSWLTDLQCHASQPKAAPDP
jgi:hypothetical protein